MTQTEKIQEATCDANARIHPSAIEFNNYVTNMGASSLCYQQKKHVCQSELDFIRGQKRQTNLIRLGTN